MLGAKIDIVTSLPDILHNIADHTETLHRVLQEKDLDGEFVSRLVEHIFLEEQENTATLQKLHETNPISLTKKLLDHSFFLQKIVKDEAMPIDLKQELLSHFMEEHNEWQAEPGPEPGSDIPAWTVGPLWQQGG